MKHMANLALVQAWQDAVNHKDVHRLLELSTPDIEVVGPRGSGYGNQLLLDWLKRAGLHLTTLRAFAHNNVVVVSQHGVWHNIGSGEVVSEADIASRFRIEGDRIAQFARYDTLDTALSDAGLSYNDEIPIEK